MEQKIKQAKEELFSLFENLDDVNYKYILSYRYIELSSWQEIADKITFSLPTTYRYHKLAIAKLESLRKHRFDTVEKMLIQAFFVVFTTF